MAYLSPSTKNNNIALYLDLGSLTTTVIATRELRAWERLLVDQTSYYNVIGHYYLKWLGLKARPDCNLELYMRILEHLLTVLRLHPSSYRYPTQDVQVANNKRAKIARQPPLPPERDVYVWIYDQDGVTPQYHLQPSKIDIKDLQGVVYLR